jgi:hypothetical protein
MATRSEEYRSNEQRSGRAKKKTAKKATGTPRSRAKKHAGRKATYALEDTGSAKPSRKSTRKSANRAKPDASLNVRETLQKGSPESRFRRAKAQAKGKSERV